MDSQTGGLRKPWHSLFGLKGTDHNPDGEYLDDTINLDDTFKEFNVKTKNNIKKIEAAGL